MTAAYQPSAEDLVPAFPLRTPSSRLVVAYSGGLDSTVLLHALSRLRPPGLVAVHVHHGLQPQADHWVEHCARFCADLDLPLILLRAQVRAGHEGGPEAAAREARYALLREELRPGDVLVTAHHRDDQAETVLLRLLRGSGVHGLAAMRPLGAFAPGRLWRPLLDQPRKRLHRYAEAHRLNWIEDPQNRDPRFARSWLREELLPRLRERWPQTDASLARGARLAAETVELLDALASQDLAVAGAGADALSVPVLEALSAARRHNLLRYWLRTGGFEVPGAHLIERIDTELLAAARDASPLLRWPGCELRRYRDRLFAMPPLGAVPDSAEVQLWLDDARLPLHGDCGMLTAGAPPPALLGVRHAREGERLRVQARGRARSLRNLFQEAGLPPWLRTRVPVIEIDGQIACVAGVAASDRWRGMLDQSGWKPLWQHDFRGIASPLPL